MSERPKCFSDLSCLPEKYGNCQIKKECLEAAKKKWCDWKCETCENKDYCVVREKNGRQ